MSDMYVYQFGMEVGFVWKGVIRKYVHYIPYTWMSCKKLSIDGCMIHISHFKEAHEMKCDGGNVVRNCTCKNNNVHII